MSFSGILVNTLKYLTNQASRLTRQTIIRKNLSLKIILCTWIISTTVINLSFGCVLLNSYVHIKSEPMASKLIDLLDYPDKFIYFNSLTYARLPPDIKNKTLFQYIYKQHRKFIKHINASFERYNMVGPSLFNDVITGNVIVIDNTASTLRFYNKNIMFRDLFSMSTNKYFLEYDFHFVKKKQKFTNVFIKL